MSAGMAGAVLGLAAACGALLVIARFRATAPLTLRERITPYVPMLRDSARATTPSAVDTLRALLARSTHLPERGREHSATSPFAHLVCISTGASLGFLLGVGLILRGSTPILLVVLVALGATAAEIARTGYLAHARRLREQRLSAELPDLVELLAFAVAAGESPIAALARVGGMSSGELGALVARCAAETRLGTPLDMALRDLVSGAGTADVERFVDALIVAIDRGTPLAEVLRAQAADARASRARWLMEIAGRKDVAMLIPVVFLILPTVVLIALFPGFRSLHLFLH